jgi:hypothetical protein
MQTPVLAGLCLAYCLLSAGCIKQPTPSEFLRHQYAEAYFDGETLWWKDEIHAQKFEASYVSYYDECWFYFRTDQPVCYEFFEIKKSPDPVQCPINPISWSWATIGSEYELRLKFPPTIQPCTQAYGQSPYPFSFTFKIAYP